MDFKQTGFLGLIGNLKTDLTDMIKKEITLLKTEMSEKASCMGKQAGLIAAGGVVALIGALFVLIGICFLITMGLQKAGFSFAAAAWISFFAFGAIVAIAGFMVLKKALATLKETSMKPAETLATLKEIRNPDSMNVTPASVKTDGLGKTQIAKMAAERKIEEVQAEAEAIRDRLKPRSIMNSGKQAVRRHPVEAAAIAGCTLGIGLLMRRRRHRHVEIVEI